MGGDGYGGGGGGSGARVYIYVRARANYNVLKHALGRGVRVDSIEASMQ